MSLPVDRYKKLETAESWTSTPHSEEALEKGTHTACSGQEMHQERPQTAFAASFSTHSPPAWLQVLKQLTQADMRINQPRQKGNAAQADVNDGLGDA